MKFLACVLFGAALVGIGSAQLLLPQCACDQVETCKKAYVDAIIPCADSCEEHATSAGANYQQLRTCFLDRKPQIKQALKCTEDTLEGACSATPGEPVPKRFVETLKIAAVDEVHQILERSGVLKEAKHFVSKGKDFYGCVKTCMDKKADHCASKLACGLKLPSDTKMVKSFKTCAIDAGFGTKGVQELCQCAVKSGISKLEPICGKLQIS